MREPLMPDLPALADLPGTVATTAARAALVREAGGPATLADVTLDAPGDGEVLVRVHASGVCPTDLFGMAGGAGDRFPAIFGHEGAGVVESVGPGVGSLRPGDHVVLSFDACGRCPTCVDGHPAYCDDFADLNYRSRSRARADGAAATTGWMAQSSWATHALARASNAVRIDDDVPWAVAAPLGCGILTGAGTVLRVLAPGPDDTLLVVGAGTTGLAGVMAARHRGAGRVVVSDPDPDRRALALELGASDAFAPEDVPARRLAATHVLDTVGRQETIDLALAALAPRGVCATVALHAGANRVTVSQTQVLWGRTLTGVIEGDAVVARDVPLLVALWRAGRLPVERLVRGYPFDRVGSAIDDLRAGRTIKPVLLMDDDAATSPAPAAPAVPVTLVDLLRDGRVPAADLPALWRSLPPVRTHELRGLWHGFGVSTEHRTQRLLTRTGWYGKLFRADDDVSPLVCETPDGTLVAEARLARGGATLRTVEHDGVVTASMVYDGQPVIDHFTRLSDDAVLGVMTGRDAADDGALYYFVLERAADRQVAVGDD
ncbi:alcohol dehydrogenase catalytic domain-containing protein [Isoptericola sp. NPDC056573]|uniref:alcohol dehydrogenase catalytic domain-containing protein n=1 Tax=Isoptericola sp. NPDC056573 TaxID=3345868 RepID=UPI003691FFD8